MRKGKKVFHYPLFSPLSHRSLSSRQYSSLKYTTKRKETLQKEDFLSVIEKDSHYFNHESNRRKYMEWLGDKLNVKTEGDWLKVTKQTFILNGGQKLIKLFSNNLLLLLLSFYPSFSSLPPSIPFLLIQNQRRRVERAFVKLKLKTPNDWLKVTFTSINYYFGDILSAHYDNDFFHFLKVVYPSHSFPSPSFCSFNSKTYFKSKENQRRFMEEVYKEGELKDLSDWLLFTTPSHLLRFLSSPSFSPSSSSSPISSTTSSSSSSSSSISSPRSRSSSLLNEKGIDQKKKEMKSKMKRMYGEYENNHFLLLSSIYPHYPWPFIDWKNGENMKSIGDIEHQRKRMSEIFHQLHLSKVDDWLTISIEQMKKNGGGDLLIKYKSKMRELLLAIYPSHPWHFQPQSFYSSLSNQRLFLDNLFTKLKLKSLDDWLSVKKKTLRKHRARFLLRRYSFSKRDLLSTLYPLHPWRFRLRKVHFQRVENQRYFMDQLYHRLKLNNMDEWLTVSKFTFRQYRANSLLSLYSFDLPSLLSTLYPNFAWEFDKYIKEAHCSVMKKIAFQLHIKDIENNLNEWLKVPRYLIEQYGGRPLLKYYNYSLNSLLSSIYPHHHWDFDDLIYRPHFHQSPSFIRSKLIFLQKKYQIRRKEDWYRLNGRSKRFPPLYYALTLIYPSEKWKKDQFSFRSKKSNQRKLYISIFHLFPTTTMMENYRHPKISILKELELDIFLPSLNFALEYHGSQHYHDIPQCFQQCEFYQLHDEIKLQKAKENEIALISIPFWWDLSISSLFATLSRSSFPFLSNKY